MINRLKFELSLSTAVLLAAVASLSPSNEIRPENTFSAGQLSYGSLLVDSGSTSLYVGAHGYLFRLWLYNVNDTSAPNLFAKRRLDVSAEERDECLRMGNTEVECSHRVRSVFRQAGGRLLVCSAAGMKPQLSALDGASLVDVEPARTLIGVCSPHEALNTTAVYAESGNPDGMPALYSGIRTGLSLENHLIYRPPLVLNNREIHGALRTVYTDSKWLNEPQFVGAFSADRYVYFFFREIAVEATDGFGFGYGSGSATGAGGMRVYSRVARICKGDLGGGSVLRQVWTSFVKARLNCSLAAADGAASPFYFDNIQSVFKLDDESETLFYATFTTPESRFQASAVCVYSLSAINRLFDHGVFLEQPTQASAWLPTAPDRIPANRPGACVSDSRQLSDEDLHFAKSHLLMADALDGGSPVFVRRDAPLTKIVADRRDEQRVALFALAPHRRELLKILHTRGASPAGRLLAIYALPSGADGGHATPAVRDLTLLAGEYVYVADAGSVTQFRLSQCAMHAACGWCAADPYCAWSLARSACFAREPLHSTAVGWITGLPSSSGLTPEEKCRNYLRTEAITVYPGDATRLDCARQVGATAVDDFARPRWRVDRRPLALADASPHFVHATDGGLILLNVTTAQSGTYQCLIDDSPIVEYTVIVDDGDCTRPKSVAQFRSAQREWCKKFDSYRTNLSRWQSWYDKNNNHCTSREGRPFVEAMVADRGTTFV